MPTLWDSLCKIFVREYPRALLQLFDPSLTYARARPTELKEVDLHLDSLLEVVSHEQSMLLHVEFQSTHDPTMAERLLRYNVITRMQQKLPVLSCVLYLLPDGYVPASPLRWDVPGQTDVLVFAFKSMQVSHLVPDNLIHMGNFELLTLLPLTHGGARQEMIEYMLHRLRKHGDTNLEMIGLTFATLAVRNDDPTLEWLRKRLEMMEDLFENNPVFEGVIERIKERASERAFKEGRQEGELRGKLQGAIESLRETIMTLVEQRFPSLHAFAQQQIALIEDPHTLQTLIVHLALASTLDEARHSLLSWQE